MDIHDPVVRELACCPFCGCKNLQATVMTIISCKRNQPVFTDGIDCINNDNEGDEPFTGNTLGEMISSAFGEISSANYYLTSFNCSDCGKKWFNCSEIGDYKWVKGENGLYSFVKNV